ncbi:C45 family autoproteolytic acyltransferase/hydrolase [Chloroflexota bacterium]
MSKLQLVELRGEPLERGRSYGARVAEAIRQNVEAYLRLIEEVSGLNRGASLRAAAEYRSVIETHAPDLLVEMMGIADGAGRDLSEILLINTRSELMSAGDGCTALALAPEASLDGQVLLAQNWDWYTAVEPEPIVLRIVQKDQPEILTLVEAGQVGKIGMNSAGLGVCLNFLEHEHRGIGLPLHVMLRQMLGCATLGGAAHAGLSIPRGTSANVMLAHSAGEILNLELTATDADFLYGDAGWLVHANHFECARLRAGDTGVRTSVSTVARAARARRLLGSARGTATMATLQAILTDHTYGEHAICRHPNSSAPSLQQTATQASVIMDLSSGILNIAGGQPCTTAYQRLAFSH